MFIEHTSGGGGGGGHLFEQKYYILKHRKIHCIGDDVVKWGKWFRRYYIRKIRTKHINGFFISTVFLGLDHNLSMVGPPILFETMIFPEIDSDYYQTRCATHRQALHMHQAAINYVVQLKIQAPDNDKWNG